MAYQPRIYRQQGGSELTIGEGGSINILSGGVISGITPSGSTVYQDGTLETFQAGASMRINQDNASANVMALNVGASTVGFYAGKDAPTHTATMGSIYFRTSGSMSGLYVNITQDNAGSAWRGFQQGSAIG